MLKTQFQVKGSVVDATNLRKEWAKATEKAKCPRVLIHDCAAAPFIT